MLELILVGGAASALAKLAKNNGLKGWIWALLTVVGYLGGAFITGIVLFVVAPELLNDRLILTIAGIISGGLGILIVYLSLKMRIAKKEKEVVDAEVLDSDL